MLTYDAHRDRRSRGLAHRAGARMALLIDKYGFDTDDAAVAGSRSLPLSERSRRNSAHNRRAAILFGGRHVEFGRHLLDHGHEHDAAAAGVAVPIRDSSRPAFTASHPHIVAALDPILVEHRGRLFKARFRDPIEF